MNVHPEFLELMTASIDFDLSEEELGALNLHLSSCAACRRAGMEIRSQAAAIAAVPTPSLSPTRAEQILAASLRRPAARPRWGLLAVAALLATLGGGVIAGLGMLTDEDPDPSTRPSPTEIAEVSPEPSEARSAAPVQPGVPGTATPTPRPADATAAPSPQTGGVAFPLPSREDGGDIRIAPADGGRLWVSIGRKLGTVVALLDADGTPAAGWPIEIELAFDCHPYVLGDQSIRLACATSEVDPETCVDMCTEDQIFAWDAAAKPVSGWPVSLGVPFERGFQRDGGRVIGTDLLLVESGEGEVDPETGESGFHELVRFRSDGTVVGRASVPALDWCCRIAPNGVAFGRSVSYPDENPATTSIAAFDDTGPLPGWPIEVAGDASLPSIGPDGRMYLSSWVDGPSELVVLRPDGSVLARTAVPGQITPDPRAAGPMRPLVDSTGRAFILTVEAALAFDPDGSLRTGWPYEPQTSLEGGSTCDLNEGDTGCDIWPLPPALDPAGVLYAMESSDGIKGGRLTAVAGDGSVRGDWPLVLQRPGAHFGSVAVSDERLVFAVAYEPEPDDETSITILAVEPDKTVRWGTTIVEP